MTAPLTVTVIGDCTVDLDTQREGSGWVSRLRDLLMITERERAVTVVDATEAGTTVHRLRERWCDDVLLCAPDVVLVHIGISDAWGMAEANNAYAKDPAALTAVLEELLVRAAARIPGTRIILLDPILNAIGRSPMRMGPVAEMLATYVPALRALATRRGLEWFAAGSLVTSAKQLRNSDEYLGCDPLGLDTDGCLLLAQGAADCIRASTTPGTVLQDGQRLLLIGDSITDSGRRSPGQRPMGSGYARLFQGLQAARSPTRSVHMINKGIGGDTIIDIESRWERDVTPYRPDWLLLYTGINDMNSIYGSRPVKLLPPAYGSGLERVLSRARTVNAQLQLVLLAPFFLSRDDHPDSYRCEMLTRMPAYSAEAARVARQFQARFLDLQVVMQSAMQRFGNRALGSHLGADLVHPGEFGSLVIADALALALGA